MKTYSFYDQNSGLFTPRTLTCRPEFLPSNTPAGHAAIEGAYDHLSYQVDLGTGQVVDYVPSPPPDTEEHTWTWDTATRRWAKVNTLLGEQTRLVGLLTQAFAPLAAAQERPLRELAVASATGTPPPTDAVVRLQQIESRALALRQQMDVVRLCENAEQITTAEAQVLALLVTL